MISTKKKSLEYGNFGFVKCFWLNLLMDDCHFFNIFVWMMENPKQNIVEEKEEEGIKDG
jgi:hypothetical protein